MTGEQAKSQFADSFTALGATVRLFSEKFGIEIWLVTEITTKDRVELTAEEVYELVMTAKVLGAELLEIRTRDGRVLRPIPGWEERVRQRELRDLQIQYDLILEQQQEIHRLADDPTSSGPERARLLKMTNQRVKELDQLIEKIRERGFEPTDAQIRLGFRGARAPDSMGNVKS